MIASKRAWKSRTFHYLNQRDRKGEKGEEAKERELKIGRKQKVGEMKEELHLSCTLMTACLLNDLSKVVYVHAYVRL